MWVGSEPGPAQHRTFHDTVGILALPYGRLRRQPRRSLHSLSQRGHRFTGRNKNSFYVPTGAYLWWRSCQSWPPGVLPLAALPLAMKLLA